MNTSQFKSDANIMPMMEKMVMQVMQKNGMLTGNKTFAIVKEIQNDSTLTVIMQQSGVEETVNCTPSVEFEIGSRVIVEYINNNPHDKFVMGMLGRGSGDAEIEPIDYSNLPSEPVEIFRGDDGRADSFTFGYNDVDTTWSQKLVRDDEKDYVVEIIHRYPDGTVFSRFLHRDEEERVYKYE